MNGILDIRGLAFSYGANRVFSSIDLSVTAGQVVCLMGPNGSGKTTLIDTVMGVKKPETGEIILCGKSLSAYKRYEIAQKIAYVPQIHDVTFPYTVREMVLMGRTAYAGAFGRPTKEDEEICEAAMARIGILKFASKPYNQLSGGEIKLVLLARALGQKTPIMLLDEPTAHLDYKNELLFLETIASECKASDITVVIATHSPDHAFYFATQGLHVQTVMMDHGDIQCYGAPDDVITSENIQSVYGVKAKIISDTDETGRSVRRVMLLETV